MQNPNLKRVFLVGDSLCLPRGELSGCPAIVYEETYPFLVRQSLERGQQTAANHWEVLTDGRRGRTMEETALLWPEIMLFRPNVAFVHVGIVDCAPRVLTPLLRKLIGKTRPRFIQRRILKIIERHRVFLVQYLNHEYVPEERYRRCAREIAESCKINNVHLVFIAIAPPGQYLTARSKKIIENVKRYNAALREVCAATGAGFLDLSDHLENQPLEQCLLTDGHHLSPAGHRLLADRIMEWLTEHQPKPFEP